MIEGQATAAMELISEVEKLDYLFGPIGGGGLMAGTALAAHYFSAHTKVVAGEPRWADDAFRAMRSGSMQPILRSDTIADGLRTPLGDKTFPIIQSLVEKIILVEEEEIIHWMYFVWQRMKIMIEPSAAVAVAAVWKYRAQLQGQKVGVILSGGNVAAEMKVS